ncbi:hypothetical protein [Chelativorans xinjiangense]|nr:hypothetical protein [Chelativorans xinjiangense]
MPVILYVKLTVDPAQADMPLRLGLVYLHGQHGTRPGAIGLARAGEKF